MIGRLPSVYPDTVDYQRLSSLSLFDPLFWTYWKPWGLPLLYKVLPGPTTDSAPLAQWVISIASWLVLALTVAGCLERRAMRIMAFTVVLAFSLTPLVAQWDGVLLTESLSASLTALLVAALLGVVRSPRPHNAVLVLAVTFALSATRDTNAYLALFLVCPLGLWLAFRGRRWVGVAVAGGVALVFAYSVWSYNVNRWETPMQGVIAWRILPSPGALRYFEARGMPVRPGLQSALLVTRIPPSRFDEAPELAYFRPWFARHARSTYLGYLVSHPGATVGDPLRGLDQLVAPKRSLPLGLDFFRPQGFQTVLPGPVEGVLYSQDGVVVVAWMCLAAVAAFVLFDFGLATRLWLVPLLGLAATLPLSLVIWNGDQLGLDRHSLVIGLIARLSVLLLTLFMLDAFASRVTERRAARLRA